MRKLYLISNYITSLYELDDNDMCVIKAGNKENAEIIDTFTIEEGIKKFKSNSTVKIHGIIQATIQKREDFKIVDKDGNEIKDAKLFGENGKELKMFTWTTEKHFDKNYLKSV